MADNDDVLKCPLCEGHGEVRVREVLQLLRDQTLESKIERGLSGNVEPAGEPAELTTVGATSSEPRDFQKDVHSWNPQLPMWRRSPKE
jgi:hypothetical protein